jgi:hypothetical protein
MNHSLAAVASRIQERNHALTAELATLEILRSRLGRAESDLASDEAESSDARVRLLVAARARHGTELERHRASEDARRVGSEIDALRGGIERSGDRRRELGARFDADHAPAYAEHDVRASLYAARLGCALESAERRRRVREGRLRSLGERTESHMREVDEMRLERERLTIGFEELDRREEEDDEETMALGMQIKSVLAKVRLRHPVYHHTACFSYIIASALAKSEDFHPGWHLSLMISVFQKASVRSALNEAREELQATSSNRDKWERRVVDGNLDYID